MRTTAYRIVDNHDSNIESLMRTLMIVLLIRGTSFLHRETKENGNELLIFLSEEFLEGDIYESSDFLDISVETINRLIYLIHNKEYTSIVDVEYNINIFTRNLARKPMCFRY